jgi:tRNA (guanine-N7-)-methyltransferase
LAGRETAAPRSRSTSVATRGDSSSKWLGVFPSQTFWASSASASVFKAREKIAREGLNNAEVFHGDAHEVLNSLPDTCADYVHVLFPDPWPKRRHKNRRIVGPAFLVEVSRLLKAGGRLRLVTDDPDYARAMESHTTSISRYRRIESEACDYPPTEFQLKFVAVSRPIFRLLFERLS